MLAEVVVAAGAVTGSALTVWKVVIPVSKVVRKSLKRFERAIDVVVGTPEIPDPDRPGQLLRPAIPDIGARVTAVEDVLHQTIVRHAERAEQAATRSERAAKKAASDAERAVASANQVESRFTEVLDSVAQLEARLEARLGGISPATD